MGDAQSGLLLLADISGYTGYLNDSELEHAHGTLTDLLQILIDRSGPPLTVSKLEGDAVFSYGLDDAFDDGQTFVELIEGTYVAFRRAIDSMVLNNTCQCKACANVGSLDLKFFVHFGSFIFQHLHGRDELVGSDVALVHRLMKNTVVESTGIHAYCLYTDAAHEQLGLGGIEGFVEHREHVSDFGDIDLWLHDMSLVYDAAAQSDHVSLPDDEALFVLEGNLPMSASVVWGYLADPRFRTLLIGSDRQEVTDRRSGRIGVGTTYQCYHGRQVLPQTILQWEPFATVVTNDVMPKPMKGTGVAVVRLEETDRGTRITRTVGRLEGGPMLRMMGPLGFHRMMRGLASRGFEAFLDAVQSDWQKRPAAAAPTYRPDSAAIRDAARAELTGGTQIGEEVSGGD